MKIKDVINKMVLILMLMVIIISAPLCKMILLFAYIITMYIITNMGEEEKAKQDVIEAVFYDE